MVLVSSQAPSSSQQVCGNHWEQTALMLLTATRRDPLRLTLSRALSGNPSIFQKAKQELVSGSSRILHLSLLSQTSNAPTVSQQSDVVLNVTECGLLFFTLLSVEPCVEQLPACRPRTRCRNATNGHSMRSARGYGLRGKATCQPTGLSSTRQTEGRELYEVKYRNSHSSRVKSKVKFKLCFRMV